MTGIKNLCTKNVHLAHLVNNFILKIGNKYQNQFAAESIDITQWLPWQCIKIAKVKFL